MRITYIEGLEKREIIDDKERFIDLLKTYSDTELLRKGKIFAEDEDYISAGITFKELCSRGNIEARLYLSVTQPGTLISLEKMAPQFNARKFMEGSEVILDSMISGMINAMELHKDNLLPNEDLFIIEKIVDRFPFRQIKTKPNFDRTYFEFKEYVADVYIKNKSQ
jgi:hypothetical protein